MIDTSRFLARFDAMAAIGATPAGGVDRLAASSEDGAARDLLRQWFAELGMRVLIDPLGNMLGVLDLAGPDAPLVMAGSHLDSQPEGGRFDGALGVVAACEAAAVLQGAGSCRCNFAVANWTGEEGARFQPSLLGSAFYAGEIASDVALASRDRDGIRLGDALRAIGYAGTDALPRPAAYMELHIECGPLLEQQGAHLGVFTHHWGAIKHRLAFVGEQAHTGPTPMADRRDALLGAAWLIAELSDMAATAPGVLHTSVGRLDVRPNSPNVVPAEAVLFIELRSVDPDVLVWAEAQLRRRAAIAAERARVVLEWRAAERRPAGGFDAGLTALCEAEAGTVTRLATVPGHDAISLTGICPAAMLVVPSAGGICHHPDEFTPEDEMVLGADTLTRVLWRLCRDGVAR